MPLIKEYTSQVGAPGPVQVRNATAEDFGLAEAQAISSVGQGVSQLGEVIQKRAEQAEISKAHADWAEFNAKKGKEFRERLAQADPNDSTFVDRFMADYDTEAEKLQEGIVTPAGQNYYRKANAEYKAHFFEMAAQGQAELAATQLVGNMQKAINSNATALFDNPSGFQTAVASSETYFEDLLSRSTSPQMTKAIMAAKETAKSNYAEASIRGWIRLNTDDARQRMTSSEFAGLLSEDQIKQLQGEADTKDRADSTQKRLDAAEARQARQDEMAAATTDYIRRLYSTEPGNKPPTMQEVIADKRLDAQHIEYVRDKMEQKLNAPPKPNAALWNSVYRKIDDGEITTERQLEAYMDQIPFEAGRGYNIKNLMKHLQGTLTPEGQANRQAEKDFMKLVEHKIRGKDTGVPDPRADDIIAETRIFFQQEKERLRSQGKDTSQLLTSSSPEYFLKKVPERAATEKLSDLAAQYGAKAGAASGTKEGPQFYDIKPPRGLTDAQKRYNVVVKQFGGSPGQMFGPNGEEPVNGLHVKAALEAERLGKINEEFAKKEKEAARNKLSREEQAKQDAKLKEQTEQNKARQALGLPPINSAAPEDSPDDYVKTINGRRETPEEWRARTKGK